MIAFSYYLLKVIICSALLFAYYLFVLRNKVFHGYNRFYLLSIIVLSLTLPCLQFNIFHKADVAAPNTIKILQVVTATDDYVDEIIAAPTTQHSIGFSDVLPYLFMAVCALFLNSIISLIVRIIVLQRKHKAIQFQNIYLINTDAAKGTPFSFFRTIFWNNKIDIQSATGNRIFKHELAHIQELHSYDKLFVSLVLAIFWCNPIFWLIKKELHMIHEFIADKYAVEDGNTADFASMLLAVAYPQHSFGITNHFFYSPIKRRLAMITKNKNPKVNYLGRIIALPLAMLVFTAFTIKVKTIVDNKATNNYTTNTTAEHAKETSFLNKIADIFTSNDVAKNNTSNTVAVLEKTITVVIDAGHGGTDNGATIEGETTTEKELTLALAKKIKALNTNEKINIIFTREDDTYSSPKEKAAFAKAQNADLFISIHIDALNVTDGVKNKKGSGFSLFIANDEFENTIKSKWFASTMINSFKSNYELEVESKAKQRKASIWVLQANSFPSILLEAGYLSNPKDVAYLKSDKGQEVFAQNVLNGIVSYATANNLASGAVQKALVDSPPKVELGVEVRMAEENEENAELLKHPRITRLDYDLDNKTLPKSLIIINGKIVDISELNNKTIKGGTARIYKKGSAEMVKKYGQKAVNEVTILENAIIIETDKTKAENSYIKNALTIKMDSIVFIKEDGEPLNISGDVRVNLKDKGVVDVNGNIVANADASQRNNKNINNSNFKNEKQLYIVDGQVIDRVTARKIDAKLINSIKVLKGKQATDKYGDKAKDGAVEITTKVKSEIIEVKGVENTSIEKRQEPFFLIGSLFKPRLKAEEFVLQKEIKINSKAQDFAWIKFKSATVYFHGEGFKEVETAYLKSSDFTQLKSYLIRCKAGTGVTFVDVKVETSDGIRSIDERSFMLY